MDGDSSNRGLLDSMVVQSEVRRDSQPSQTSKEVVGGPATRFWTKILGLYGLVGEFFAHGVFLERATFPTCSVTDWFCATGIPSIRDSPWLAYHVSVHFILGLAVVLLILPEKWKKFLRVVNQNE
jgi:hypothetical protein